MRPNQRHCNVSNTAKPPSITIDFTDTSILAPEYQPGKGNKTPPPVSNSAGVSEQFIELGYHIPLGAARSRIPMSTPFTVLVDTREQIATAWTFRGMFADSKHGHRPLTVVTERHCLGLGMGDYSIKGMHPRVLPPLTGNESPGDMPPTISIERKAKGDAHSTFLGWGTHRENFEQELANLSGLTFAAIVIECPEHELIRDAPEYGKKAKDENAWTLRTSINAWRVAFPRVQWVFAEDRTQAECTCFRLLERFFKEYVK
jgi:hypothetical protein